MPPPIVHVDLCGPPGHKPPLPRDLSGLQHLAADMPVEEGDIATLYGQMWCYVSSCFFGYTAEEYERATQTKVYRRLPVAKQGDLDHKTFNKEPQAMLPTDPAARKRLPIYSGFLAYFPDAVAAVAECSQKGNDQHSPGQPLRWDRSKSGDEADALMRHLLEHGKIDIDGIRHSSKLAWRSMALLQKEIEADRLKP